MYSPPPPVSAPPALQRLRGWEEVDEELSEMRLENQSERAEGQLSVVSLLSQASLRWQLTSIIVMNMGQQLSGVNAVRLPEPRPGLPLHWFIFYEILACFVSSEPQIDAYLQGFRCRC